MMIAHAVLLKIALVAAGGDDARVADGQNAEVCIRILRILKADLPVAAVRLGADGGNVAAQREDRGADACVRQELPELPGGVALGDAAEIELCAGLQGDAAAVHADAGCAGHGKKRAQLLRVRDAVSSAGKAPCEAQGIERRVICAAGRLGKIERRLHQRGGLGADGQLSCAVAAGKLCLGRLTGKKPLQPVDLFFRRLQGIVRTGAVGRGLHDSVHGEKFARAAGVCAAGQQQERQAENKKKLEMFHRKMVVQSGAVLSPDGRIRRRYT